MRKFLSSLVFFMMFLGVTYSVVLLIWGTFVPQLLKPNLNYRRGSNGHLFTRVQDIQNYSNVDVLFLGSSQAYRGFDTRIFKSYGFYSFNLGSSGQTPMQTKVLLDRYLDKLNPELVIYEVFPLTFISDGVESSVDVIANDQNDLSSVRMAIKINHIKTYNTLLYGIMADNIKLYRNYQEPKIRDDDQYIDGGYVEKKEKYFRYLKHKSSRLILNEKNVQAFEEIILILKEKRINYLLVYAPLTSSYYKSFTNNEEFDSLMRSYGPYYNFNTIINLDDSLHFFDQTHLNQVGVKLFNEEVIKTLQKIKLDE